jgi:hypothetical protein
MSHWPCGKNAPSEKMMQSEPEYLPAQKTVIHLARRE